MSRREGFLDRWSRLKQTEEPASEPAGAEAPAPVEDERSDAEILEELGLPDPETLEPGDDVTGFMAKAVPERLRRAALRRLWRSNPILANVDGLVEYGEDYTDSALVVENLQTLYQVGKGMFWEERAAAAEAAEAAEDEVEEDDADAGAEISDMEEAEPEALSTEENAAPSLARAEVEAAAPAPLEAPAPPTRRRMRFN